MKEILTLQDIIHNCGKPFLEGDSCFSNLVFNTVLCAGCFRHVADLQKETSFVVSHCHSACPHGIAWLPQDEFL